MLSHHMPMLLSHVVHSGSQVNFVVFDYAQWLHMLCTHIVHSNRKDGFVRRPLMLFTCLAQCGPVFRTLGVETVPACPGREIVSFRLCMCV